MRHEKDNALPSISSGDHLDLGTRVFELAVRKWNLGQYLLGAVGLVAGVAIILRLSSGSSIVPLIGGPILFVFVVLIRIFSPAPEAPPIPHQHVMQAVIGWACVLMLLAAIGLGMWWTVWVVFPRAELGNSAGSPATIARPHVPAQAHQDNLKGLVRLSGEGVKGALVTVGEGVCVNSVSATTVADGFFSAYCEQTNPNDVIVISAEYRLNGIHCHAQTDSSTPYKLTDHQTLDLKCEQSK